MFLMTCTTVMSQRFSCVFSFDLFQIRVVNAFQEPGATPAQMPFRGRTSLASLASVAKLESSKSIDVKEPICEPTDEAPAIGNTTAQSPTTPSSGGGKPNEAETRV